MRSAATRDIKTVVKLNRFLGQVDFRSSTDMQIKFHTSRVSFYNILFEQVNQETSFSHENHTMYQPGIDFSGAWVQSHISANTSCRPPNDLITELEGPSVELVLIYLCDTGVSNERLLGYQDLRPPLFGQVDQ